ncbi:DUF6286 domain-containing protein [Streptomyces sp. t39]|uniref:DUF6286 domain-containing protein n=1 Tax=Streptomyces sp. t39 TaxID=1828156 RepID=UPI0011CE4D65|nr:DUF6286 domain-containing protein [Streptomyces sp. t39]TXS51120.1 hypothetical protein EAO77_24755 [Streptomyces sp. t39]
MTEPEPPGGEGASEAGRPVAGTDQSAVAGTDQSAVDHRPAPAGKVATGRFWSARRVPAALVAAVVLGAAGLLLYDVAAVRADRPAMEWRRRLADHLADWRLDEVGVLAVSAAVALLGVLLLALALTPGLRALLTMRPGRAGVRAALDRDAAALVLRDRAMEVSGVQSVRVKMRRSKASVRARSHFRPVDEVRADLDKALGAGLKELGLARPPALAVRVGRPPAGKK